MKKIYLLFILFTCFVNAQEPFITTWTSNYVEIPIVESPGNNYTIDFGDGTILTNQTGPVTHSYFAYGTYTITIIGNFGRLDFNSSFSNPNLLKTIEQWGDNQWTSMEGAFFGCSYLTVNATDIPNISQVTNMSSAFEGCDNINMDLNNWDVSNVSNMHALFKDCYLFNQPLHNWNISNATDISEMFAGAHSFNQSLNNWNVANVSNMSGMFAGALAFNQPLNNWNVSNATDMSYMFSHTNSFNQSLNDWDVSGVTAMNNMFIYAKAFDQPLDNWDVSNVINMLLMFAGAETFNQSINSWDVANVNNMKEMFGGAVAFNQPLNNWDVSNVTDMSYMFSGAYSFNQSLSYWDISNVTTMANMFSATLAFNQPLDNWDMSNIIIDGMFWGAEGFNQDLSGWNFNPNTDFGYFVSLSGLGTENYDRLLLRFAQLGLENKHLISYEINYCDQEVRNYLINELGWTIQNDTLGEACQGNNISGNVIYDENANGCDTEDPLTGSFLVTANNGEFTYSTLSSNGEYDLRVMEDTYNVGLLNVPSYFTVTPGTSEISFTGFGNEEELNFCLTANETVNDLNITLLPLGEARPGFESQYRLVAENIGTQTITGVTASLTYNETIQSFVSASQTPASTTANQLNFDLGTMLPLETKTIDITMVTFTPPTIEGGETINFVATITPDTDDYTPNDNTFNYDQEVVNSYDPNDKRVLQGDEIYMEQTEGYLDYIIRFQNTGTASAITVRIEDLLHENLDWTTFKPVSASHSYKVEITNGNQVEFTFNNINLPHEDANEPGSHGFMAYKIKPVSDIQVGDMITGTAGIFFDYNLPIITNSADTEVVEPPLGVNEYNIAKVSLYPNPASSALYLRADKDINIENIKIYNLQGSEIASFDGNQQTIDIQNLSAGLYLVSIQTDKGISKHRLIKK